MWHSLKNRKDTKIVFDLKNTRGISSNMCSALGLILEKIKLRKNNVYFRNIPISIKNTLINNEFFKVLDVENYKLDKDNFLAYKNFSVKDKEKFELYLIDKLNLFAKENVLTCNIKDIVRAISEMFINVKMHTSSREVVTCGFYDIGKKEMLLTISNHGITINKNIERRIEYIFNKDIDAIEWAIKKSSSTRRKGETGGLGLYTTRKFIREIHGELIIASGRGYWCENNKGLIKEEINSSFPGTIITFRLPLNYKVNANEQVKHDIFSLDDIIRGDLW